MKKLIHNKYVLLFIFCIALLSFGFFNISLYYKDGKVVQAASSDSNYYIENNDEGYIKQTYNNSSVFFYVDYNGKLIKNNEFLFLEEDETVTVNLARVSSNTGEYDIKEGFVSSANASFIQYTLNINNIEQTNLSGVVKEYIDTTGDRSYQYFYQTLNYNTAIEGQYYYVFSYYLNNKFGDSILCSFDYTFFLFKNETYRNAELPDVELFIPDENIVTLNNDPYVAREMFYNYDYEYSTDLSSDIFKYPKLRYDFYKYELNIVRTFQGRQHSYDFRLINGELVCIKNTSTSPDLDFKALNNDVTIIFKDLGIYTFTYKYVFYLNGVRYEINKIDYTPKKDILNIFGFQVIYSDLDKGNTELRDKDHPDIASDITYRKLNLIDNEGNINNSLLIEDIKKISTNSPPVSFLFNSEILEGSLVYKKTGDSWSTSIQYNGSNFSDSGEYIVKIKYKYSNYKTQAGNNVNLDPDVTHTQWFYFKITHTTPDTVIKTEDEKNVYSGQFTNQKITVSINKTSIFDSVVEVIISRASFSNLNSFTVLTNINSKNSQEELSKELEDNYRYRVQTLYGKNLSKSLTTTFTIDKEEISGLQAYSLTYSNYSKRYIKSDALSTMFTNSSFAIDWNYKNSSSVITAYYHFIPINKLDDGGYKPIFEEELGEILISNGYVIDYNAFTEAKISYSNTKNSVVVSGNNILSQQGLYMFYLKDQAGNDAAFYIILDESPINILQMREKDDGSWEYFEKSLINYISFDTRVVWGTHKTIAIYGISDDNLITNNLFELFLNSSLVNKVIYNDGSNRVEYNIKNKIIGVVRQKNNENYEKLNVANKYNEIKFLTANNFADESNYNFYVYDSSNFKLNSTSTAAQIVADYTTMFNIIVTSDMSRSTLLTSTEWEDILSQRNNVVFKDDDIIISQKTYQITGHDKVYFAYISQIGDIRVEVSCLYYSLEFDTTNKTYYYSNSSTEITLSFDSISMDSGDIITQFKIGVINLQSMLTQPGKYIITRTYEKEGEGTEYDSVREQYDYYVRNFMFFVDRNPVITPITVEESNSYKKVGEYAKVLVLYDNEEEDTTFNIPFSDLYKQNQNITNYSQVPAVLTTNKLPVAIKIPYVKYGSLNNSVFTTDNINANIMKDYDFDSGEFTYELHKDLMLRAELYFYPANYNEVRDGAVKPINFNTYLSNGYLDIPLIRAGATLGIGKYIIIISDNIVTNKKTNNWTFVIEVTSEAPKFDLISIINKTGGAKQEVLIEPGISYTNADEIKVSWTDPMNNYLAKIDKTEISYKINNLTISVLEDDIKSENNKHYFIIKGLNNGLFTNNDKIIILMQYEGSSEYYKQFSVERTIFIDYIAPNTNLNTLVDGVIIRNESELNSSRIIENKYNKTIQTGELEYYTYAISSNFVFDISGTTNTKYLYYKKFNEKYSGLSHKETSIPTDPNGISNQMFDILDFTLWNSNSSLDSNNIYEIVEIDEAGNYTIYSVYVFDPEDESLVLIRYNSTQEVSLKNNDVLGVYDNFRLNNFIIPGINPEDVTLYDMWYKINISVEGQTATTFIKTPACGENEFLNASGNKVSLTTYNFENNKRYKIEYTNRMTRSLESVYIIICPSSLNFNISLKTTENNGVYTHTFTVLKSNLLLVYNTTNLNDSIKLYAKFEDNDDYTPIDIITINNLVGSYNIIYTTSENNVTYKLEINTIFKNNNGNNDKKIFYFIPNEQYITQRITGEEIIYENDVIMSSKEIYFRYNNLKYNVEISPENYDWYDISTLDQITTITFKSTPLNVFTESDFVGGVRNFTLTITNLIDDEDTQEEILKIQIDNRLAQVNLYDDYGTNRNLIYSGNAITKQAVTIKFNNDENLYYVTVRQKNSTVAAGVIESGMRITGQGDYEIIVGFKDGRMATYKREFTISQSDILVFSVKGRNSSSETLNVIAPSGNIYEYNGKNYPLYITNYSLISIVTDSSLDITDPNLSFRTIQNPDPSVIIRLYTISNINSSNQSIYIDEEIVVMIIPKSTTILSNIALDSSPYTKMSTDIIDSIVVVENNYKESITLSWQAYFKNSYNKIRLYYYFGNNNIPTLITKNIIIVSTSGLHRFEFIDMAGNKHIFTTSLQNSDKFELYFIKSVMFLIKGINTSANLSGEPINYAVYNSGVVITLPQSSLNFLDSSAFPVINVERNGMEYKDYVYTSGSRTFTFMEAGFYSVSFNSKRNGQPLKEEKHYFTIINENEIRWAYEFAEYEKYEVVSIFKNDNELLKGNKLRYLSINISQPSGKLQSSGYFQGSGIYHITIKAARNDSNITPESFSFKVWIKDSSLPPPIEISAQQGVETTDIIHVKFNVRNIYEVIGDCEIRVGKEIIIINESTINTLTEVQDISVTVAGDYYVQAYTANGNLIYSYRIIKKDPLNTIAIIVIVVGSLVAIALVIVFVKLRKKVRIR